GFLSGPDGKGRGIAQETANSFPATDPHRATKAFLSEHRALFGHGPEALHGALVKRDFVAPHNGLHTAVGQQQVDNIPVSDALLVYHRPKNGELVTLASRCPPNPAQAASAGTSNRAAVQVNPPVTAAKAVAYAAQNIGETLESDAVTPSENSP